MFRKINISIFLRSHDYAYFERELNANVSLLNAPLLRLLHIAFPILQKKIAKFSFSDAAKARNAGLPIVRCQTD